ncbi:hypothetical protein ACQEVB_32450 [Pseudonocardia sp. CA-107938]|uniref:hypothetical protein n=1 Tax=Pseudonocardia sp. CA-107938 TaxID=3240021 RepID=UPI003D92E9D5
MEYAAERVAQVRDDPAGRLRLLDELYRDGVAGRQAYLPYRRAAAAFMAWQLRRRLLDPPDGPSPGSPWWRAVNERLLRDGWEARARAAGCGGPPPSPSTAAALAFITRPTARSWYRAHNASIAAAYLDHHDLARAEGRVERFFLNVVLIRVMYAHAMVAAPRLALGWLGPAAPLLGDPRLGMTGIFLSLSRILPDRYPLDDDVERLVAIEHGFGHLVDFGVIQPRLARLYAWSAVQLGVPELRGLVEDGIPTYAWSPADTVPWTPRPSRAARVARRVVR